MDERFSSNETVARIHSNQGTSWIDLVGMSILIVGTTVLSRVALLDDKKNELINS